MGSYDGICAVSNLPIRVGDEVAWVYFTPDYIENTHDMGEVVWRYLDSELDWINRSKANEEFRERFKDTFEGSSEWRDLWSEKIYRQEKEYFWGYGEYDDYGWVEGEELPDRYLPKSFLVRRAVFDKMAEFGKTLISREWSDRKNHLQNDPLYCFLVVCNLTRISLLGHFGGRQSGDMEEMRERKFVHRVIGEEIKVVAKEISDEDKEYKVWCKQVKKDRKERSSG